MRYKLTLEQDDKEEGDEIIVIFYSKYIVIRSKPFFFSEGGLQNSESYVSRISWAIYRIKCTHWTVNTVYYVSRCLSVTHVSIFFRFFSTFVFFFFICSNLELIVSSNEWPNLLQVWRGAYSRSKRRQTTRKKGEKVDISRPKKNQKIKRRTAAVAHVWHTFTHLVNLGDRHKHQCQQNSLHFMFRSHRPTSNQPIF